MIDPDKANEILSKLVISEEQTIAQLDKHVNLAQNFIGIKKENAEVEITVKYPLTLKEKATLFLIGKYFGVKLNFHTQELFSLSEISSALDTKQTTLSGKIGGLIQEKVILKPKKDQYKMNYSKIQSVLEELAKKYMPQNKDRT